MSDVMGMGMDPMMGGMDPETALAMEMMMGAPMPDSGMGGGDAPCTICGALVPIDSGAPVEVPGMGESMPGMGMDMGGGIAPPMPPAPPMM